MAGNGRDIKINTTPTFNNGSFVPAN
jgi:hypothetical protein